VINGDISNSTPPRIIVVADVVVESIVVDNSDTPALKKFFTRTPEAKKVIKWNNMALAHLWRVADRYGLSVELVGYADEDWSQKDLDNLMSKLDARGGNPFNYAQIYDDFHELVAELPYRGNLKAVIDQPGGVARYGSYGLELQNL
jgi:hypothetical protein